MRDSFKRALIIIIIILFVGGVAAGWKAIGIFFSAFFQAIIGFLPTVIDYIDITQWAIVKIIVCAVILLLSLAGIVVSAKKKKTIGIIVSSIVGFIGEVLSIAMIK